MINANYDFDYYINYYFMQISTYLVKYGEL